MERSAEGRAFAWGALGNILEMDDVDKQALLHPGPVTVPAALALAAQTGASAACLLDAIVRGYEATIRLGRAVGAGHYALWHNTGTCGAIGAAAACAILLDLPEDGLADALALGVSQSAGFWQTRHEPASLGKQLHTANAARAGVSAARLAASGARGPRTILEGPQGFFAAMCPGAAAQDVLAVYPEPWLIADVSTKPWPACRHAHAAIDAALVLRPPGAEGRILVETYRDALRFCDNPAPRTVAEAKFSLQHAVAVSLIRGAPRLGDFSLAAIDDPALASMRGRIDVREDGAFTRAYPGRFGARVSGGGAAVEVADAWGDPENPITDDEVKAKTRALLAAADWSAADAEALIGAASGLTGAGTPGDLLALLEARLG
ncbi:MAG: MmgE/PrpD family protein [Hyphomonas sp.]|uniref:MmgE/PrpD family protein n=1 Tax=Hyphomonas sp. TaxID=87 RepID=UPI0034A0A4EE